MKIPERYKLIFNWEGLRYEGDTAYFDRAAFTGPVLKIMAKVEGEDSIDLDFTDQNMKSSIFIPSYYYIAKLSWKNVIYRPWGIELTECKLDHQKTGSLRELKDGMKFYVDCSKHEHTTHNRFLVYPAWVVNEHGIELQ